MEAGVAGQRQLDGGAAERPADGVLASASRTTQPQQRARLLLGRRRPAWSVRASVQRTSAGRRPARAASICSRTSAALASMSRPVRTKVDLVAEAAERGSAPTLSVGGGASPRTPPIRTRSGPSWVEPDGVEAGRDVGAGVAGAAVSYSSWAVTVPTVTAPPVPGCLVMTRAAVGVRSRRAGSRGGAGRRCSAKNA